MHLRPGPGLHPDELARVQAEAETAFLRYFDHRFFLTGQDGQQRVLRVALHWQAQASGSHLLSTLYPGRGADEPGHWYVASPPIHRAHELAHQLGLKDEYQDPQAPGREKRGAPGIMTDHSLMGNYVREGIEEADLRLRHGRQLAADLSQCLGDEFTAHPSPVYLVRPGDTLGWIAARYYGQAHHWPSLYRLNRAQIEDHQRLSPGLALRLPYLFGEPG